MNNIIVIIFVMVISFLFGYFYTSPIDKEKTYKTQILTGTIFSLIGILVLGIIIMFGKLSS